MGIVISHSKLSQVKLENSKDSFNSSLYYIYKYLGKENRMQQIIGFIGLGTMGFPMAARLVNAGYQVAVYNRTKKKAEPLLLKGARWCSSPADVAQEANIVLSMVSTPGVLEEIALGKDGVLSGINEGGVFVDCSTVSPELTKRLFIEFKKKGCSFLHSPVLGSVPQILDGSLLFFTGGPAETFSKIEPILKSIGSRIWQFDTVEQATTTKLICNSFIAGMALVLSQALVLAKKSEIDPKTLLEIISQSQLNAPMYQAKGAAIIDRNFTPRFFVEHLLKDINLVLDLAHSLNVPFPVGMEAKEYFTKAIQQGLAKEDYSAVIKVLETEAGITV
jgi:3-hydroxyisobutyrate dehydrogenase-like beta-hydroxyacid dehydrogenase